MRKIILIFSMFFVLLSGAQAKKLSNESKVYLMTVGPYYKDFASIWGHVAIWIEDKPNGIDKVYNYGGAAYGGNFMLKLVTGNLTFFLDTHQTFQQELKTYKRAERDVDLYELNLNILEKRRLYNLLEQNAKNENRYYNYEFYLRNCATFTMNAIKKSIVGKIVYEDTHNDITYRDICDDKFQLFPWTNFLIQLIAGTNNDKKLELEEIFFVPVYMVDNLQKAKIVNRGGEKPFFKNHKVIYDFPDMTITNSLTQKPIFPISILFIIEILLFAFSYIKSKNYFKIYDRLWFILASLFSLFLLFTMLFTDYVVTKWNLNLLWLNPLFILTFFLKEERKKMIFKIISVMILIVLLGFAILPQTFYLVNLLLAAILLLKSLKYGFLFDRFNK